MTTIIFSISGGLIMFALIIWVLHRERKKNRYSPFTEKMLRSPGYTLNNQLQDVFDDLLEPVLALCFLPVILYLLTKDVSFGVKVLSGGGVLLVVAWEMSKLRKLLLKSRKIKLGLDGEIYTGQELNYLMRKGAWVYHDIPYKYGNIDHVVISKSGIYAVETKAVRKPMNKNGGRDAKVFVKNGSLVFPHFTTSKPIKQAKQHTDYLKKALLDKTGYRYPVYAVVALPGWYVDKGKNKNGFLVVNPQRGKGLGKFIQTEKIPEREQNNAVREIELFARTVESRTDISDPDAKKKYSFFLNKKHEEAKL